MSTEEQVLQEIAEAKIQRELKVTEEKRRRIFDSERFEIETHDREMRENHENETRIAEGHRCEKEERERSMRASIDAMRRADEDKDNTMCTCPLAFLSPHR
jgi:hypothetical protein